MASPIGSAIEDYVFSSGEPLAAPDLIDVEKPEDIANAMLFLAVHPAISGQTLAVDCGRI